jgi:hypothetical protein
MKANVQFTGASQVHLQLSPQPPSQNPASIMTTNDLMMQVDPISEMPHQTYFRIWRMSNIFMMSQHPKDHVYKIYFRQWTMSSISMH